MSTVSVRQIERTDHREVVAVAARAFWFDPLIDFFTRDLLHEYRVLPGVFDGYLRDVRRARGETWVADHDARPRGVAAWLSPGGYPRRPAVEARRLLQSLEIVARSTRRATALRLFLEVERRHPKEPHWYLVLLATDPLLHGRGLGTALLAPVLQRCDAEGIVAYTETQKPENVSWYARSGFGVVDEIRLPEAPRVWCLRREPVV